MFSAFRTYFKNLSVNTKLPSKRELAADNQISVRTVMNAYDQLLTEGYITSEVKRGYFAAKLETAPERSSTFACSVSAPERTADRNFASENKMGGKLPARQFSSHFPCQISTSLCRCLRTTLKCFFRAFAPAASSWATSAS